MLEVIHLVKDVVWMENHVLLLLLLGQLVLVLGVGHDSGRGERRLMGRYVWHVAVRKKNQVQYPGKILLVVRVRAGVISVYRGERLVNSEITMTSTMSWTELGVVGVRCWVSWWCCWFVVVVWGRDSNNNNNNK